MHSPEKLGWRESMLFILDFWIKFSSSSDWGALSFCLGVKILRHGGLQWHYLSFKTTFNWVLLGQDLIYFIEKIWYFTDLDTASFWSSYHSLFNGMEIKWHETCEPIYTYVFWNLDFRYERNSIFLWRWKENQLQ